MINRKKSDIHVWLLSVFMELTGQDSCNKVKSPFMDRKWKFYRRRIHLVK